MYGLEFFHENIERALLFSCIIYCAANYKEFRTRRIQFEFYFQIDCAAQSKARTMKRRHKGHGTAKLKGSGKTMMVRNVFRAFSPLSPFFLFSFTLILPSSYALFSGIIFLASLVLPTWLIAPKASKAFFSNRFRGELERNIKIITSSICQRTLTR